MNVKRHESFQQNPVHVESLTNSMKSESRENKNEETKPQSKEDGNNCTNSSYKSMADNDLCSIIRTSAF